jgi:hypothetical protein
MIDEIENENTDDGFDDEDEQALLKYALEDFNEQTGLGWTMGDLDFIVSFPGPLTRNWYDLFNTYVESTLKKIQEGTLTL